MAGTVVGCYSDVALEMYRFVLYLLSTRPERYCRLTAIASFAFRSNHQIQRSIVAIPTRLTLRCPQQLPVSLLDRCISYRILHHVYQPGIPCIRAFSLVAFLKPLPMAALPQIPPFQVVETFPKAWPKAGPCDDRGGSPAAMPLPDPKLPNRFLVYHNVLSICPT